jgi:nucleoside phosphorylase
MSSILMHVSILLRLEVFMIQVDFAIITIREDEFEAVLQRFPAEAENGASGRTYGICQVQTKTGKSCRVAVVRSSEQGNDAAQQVANDVISDLMPQMLLVVGIAGGIPKNDFTLGDVIISTRINNLNVNKRFEDGSEETDMRGGIHPRISNITASLLLHQKALTGWNNPASIILDRPEVDWSQFETDEMKAKLADDHKNASWYKKVQMSITKQLWGTKNSTRNPRFVTGTIASSNSVVRNIDLLVQWLQGARSILAVEMESAGVYQATQKILQQYPVMAIRGISDIIGFERDDEWAKYACHSAAAFAYAFITAGIVTPREMSTVTSTSASVSPQSTQKPAQLPRTPSGKQADGTGPIEVFISYAEEDERFKKQLETHLAQLKRDKTIRPWYSQQTQLGLIQGWEQEIAEHIDSAQIVLLLMSPSFIASDQLYENEMTRAIERQKAGDSVRVIPIAVRHIAPSDPDKTPDFQKIQGLPRNGRPIEAWRSADEAWAQIAQEVREVCKALRGSTGKR